MRMEILKRIERYLDEQGLVDGPLREELLDHLMSDVKARQREGDTLEEAWIQIVEDIPPQHFKALEKETVSIDRHPFKSIKIMAYLSIGLLAATVIFKTAHFPGAPFLLLSALMMAMAALITGSISGVKSYPEKEGKKVVLILMGSVFLFFLSLVFQVFYLPMTGPLRNTAILLLLVIFPFLLFYFLGKQAWESFLLTYLHRRHTAGIERFLLVLLVLGSLSKGLALLGRPSPEPASVIFVLLIFAAGLQYFLFSLRQVNDRGMVFVLILTIILLMVPAMELPLPFPLKSIAIALFFLLAGGITSLQASTGYDGILATLMTVIMSSFSLLRIAFGLHWIGAGTEGMLFNIPVFLLILGALLLSPRYSMFRMYMIIALAQYLLVYPLSIT